MRDPEKKFSDYFEVEILKAYKKPFTRLVEEGTYISSHRGELLNSKSEWHQAKVIRTTVRVAQGGAEILQPVGRGEGDQPLGRRTSARTSSANFFKVAKVKVLIVNAAPSNIKAECSHVFVYQ